MLDRNQNRSYSMSCVLLLALVLSGCASNVVVKGNIPTPLIERLPINGAIRYTEEFKNYRYTETEKRRTLDSLDFTDAQMTMFQQIFSSLITVVPIDYADRQLVIEPEILELQYTAPRETRLKQYEIWIKYRIKLVDSDEQKIADWIIKGYGKTPTSMLSSNSDGFNAAANIALRDVGAQLSIGFGRQSKIMALVANRAVNTPAAEVVSQPLDDSDTLPENEGVEP